MVPTTISGRTHCRAEYESGTDGLRGLCALIVLYTHLFAPYPDIDPGYAPSPGFWWLEAGQGAVLLFFVLSGYVIGLTNQTNCSGAAIRNYAWRRMIRLVPLYVIAVMMSYAVRPTDSWHTVLGNLVFLQNTLPLGPSHVAVLSSNTNLWSLNYEMLYYVLFVVVWWAPRIWPVWLTTAAVLGIVGNHLPFAGEAIATYASGWIFWLAGFAVARSPAVARSRAERLPWPSLLMLWLATWHLKPLWSFGHRFGIIAGGSAWMNYTYCDLIPASIALLMAASSRRPRHARAILHLALILPLGFTIWRIARGRLTQPGTLGYDELVIAAVFLWRWRPSNEWLVRLAPVGMISYGMYIFQRPMQWLVRDHAPLPSGTAWAFALRVVITVILTVLVSYVGERKLQPLIRRHLLARTRAVALANPATPQTVTSPNA